jgi:hypothetical protein
MAHAGESTTADVGRSVIGHRSTRSGVIVMVAVVIIVPMAVSIKPDVDRRAAVITAIIVARISRPIIIAVVASSRTTCEQQDRKRRCK